MDNDRVYTGLETFKFNVTKISLILAIIILFSFTILKIFYIIPSTILCTLNCILLLIILIFVNFTLEKNKEKLYFIQTSTYFVILTFIAIQTCTEKYNIFIPIWFDFTILTAYIATNRKFAIVTTLYSFILLMGVRYYHYYNIDLFSFINLSLSLITFSILGYMISLQLDKFAKEKQAQSKKLEQLALMDELTQIFNRRAFFKISEKYFAQAKRENKPLSLFMIDLDHFKRINDTYGHEVGDIVLKTFAKEVKMIIRENDLFARIGGEEFLILFYNINKEESINIAYKILKQISQIDIKTDNDIINFTASIGVYMIDNPDSIDLKQALINVDKALYEAKNTGRNKVVFFNDLKETR